MKDPASRPSQPGFVFDDEDDERRSRRHRECLAGSNEFLGGGWGERSCEEVPLCLCAGGSTELDQLIFALDSLGTDVDEKAPGQSDGGSCDAGALAVRTKARDERPVDLELVDGETVELRER